MPSGIPESGPSLNHTQRLKAAIKYIVPAQRRPRVLELFRRFDTLQHSEREMTELMQEITELVGQQELKSVMIALGAPPPRPEPPIPAPPLRMRQVPTQAAE